MDSYTGVTNDNTTEISNTMKLVTINSPKLCCICNKDIPAHTRCYHRCIFNYQHIECTEQTTMKHKTKLVQGVACCKCGKPIPADAICYSDKNAADGGWTHWHIGCSDIPEQTNLQAAGGSAIEAFEIFDKLNPNQSFAVWCDTPVISKPKMPEWLKPGQWIRIKTYNSILLRKIKQYAEATGFVWYSTGKYDELAIVLYTEVTPIAIKPWTLAEAVAAMDAGVKIKHAGSDRSMVAVQRVARAGFDVYFDSLDSDAIPIDYLASQCETEDHKPCGTPVPM